MKEQNNNNINRYNEMKKQINPNDNNNIYKRNNMVNEDNNKKNKNTYKIERTKDNKNDRNKKQIIMNNNEQLKNTLKLAFSGIFVFLCFYLLKFGLGYYLRNKLDINI